MGYKLFFFNRNEIKYEICIKVVMFNAKGIKMNESEAIKFKRGKWSQTGVPHKGWTCVDIEDLEEPSMICEMCESQEIRYVHYMHHPSYKDELKVGCICAGHMEQDLGRAKKRDDFLKSRSSKRKRWLSRNWKISAKGNEYLKVDGYLITVFNKNGKWVGCIKEIDGNYEKFSRKNYESSDKLKLASFDLLTKILAEKDSLGTAPNSQ